MENLNIILFISIAAPMLMMLFVCKGRARMILGYLLAGVFICLFSSELSGILFSILPYTNQFLTINITPFTEELLKATPIMMYVFMENPSRQHIFEASIAVGVGFAILENAFILAENIEIVSIPLALIRGFGAGMMHGLCTFVIGFGLSYVRKKKKLYVTGTISMLCVAVMYHSLYNILVQSPYQVVGFVLPILSFAPLLALLKKHELL